MKTNNFNGFSVSCIGSSHIKNNIPCQDNSSFYKDKKVTAAIVSDGHGGIKHFRSNVGSLLANKVCKEEIPKFASSIVSVNDEKELIKLINAFKKHVLYLWRSEVEKELTDNPFTEKELEGIGNFRSEVSNNPFIAYGATLIFAFAVKGRMFIQQLGDGDCRIITENGIISPLPEDESLVFSHTASLCSTDAITHFRNIIFPASDIHAVILSSDGVSNSFDGEDSFDKFCIKISEFYGDPDADIENELKEFLPKLSRDGSSDDMSFAILKKSEQTDTFN